MELEYKKFQLKIEEKDITEDDNFFHFKGHAAVFDNVDQGEDRLLRGSTKKTTQDLIIKDKKLAVLFMHDIKMPLGVFIELREDEKGLFVHGKLPKDDTFVSGRIIPQMRVGSISEMSIGYIAVKFFHDNDNVRNLEEIEIFEASLVVTNIAMNENATVTEMKSMEFKDLPLADRLTKWDDKADRTDKKYKSCFLYCDETKENDISSYKLPIADIVDGELKAIPKAIFKAAATVQGAIGDLNISDKHLLEVKKHINRYYSKMGLDSPFKDNKTFKLDTISDFDERTLEKLFKSGVSFSSKNAKVLISALKSTGAFREETASHRDGDDLARVLLRELKSLTQTINGGVENGRKGRENN